MSSRWEPDTPERDCVVLRLLNMPAPPERVARYLDCPHSYVCERAADLEVDNEMLMNANARLTRERDEARGAAKRLPGRARRIASYLQTDDVFTTFIVYLTLLLGAAILIVQLAR